MSIYITYHLISKSSPQDCMELLAHLYQEYTIYLSRKNYWAPHLQAGGQEGTFAVGPWANIHHSVDNSMIGWCSNQQALVKQNYTPAATTLNPILNLADFNISIMYHPSKIWLQHQQKQTNLNIPISLSTQHLSSHLKHQHQIYAGLPPMWDGMKILAKLRKS